MKKQEAVKTVTLTYDYFKVYANGHVAKCIHSEVVEVFGVTHEQCFIETEDGREVHPDLEKVIHPIIKHEKHVEKSNYHTVSWRESTRPAPWFEHYDGDEEETEEETDENGETVIEIDGTTGKIDIKE